MSTAAFPGDFAAFAEVFEGPLYWPDVAADQLEEAYEALRTWVEAALIRFSWDSQVLPACWWRHAPFVEALVALRDHERGSYAPTASATAAIEFHRAVRDIEARLRAWRAELRCEATHDPSHDQPRTLPHGGFADYVADQVRRRKAAEEKAKAEEEARAKDHQN